MHMYINYLLQFAELGGFEEIKKQIETAEKVDAPVRATWLYSSFLINKYTVDKKVHF